ncbi:MAG TPA: hypothetical protein VEG25_00065 [Burkholderiales bacterium]|nr:hypothetical protein [Burkholderiales bacterium]
MRSIAPSYSFKFLRDDRGKFFFLEIAVAHRSNMEQLTDWMLWADKVIPY